MRAEDLKIESIRADIEHYRGLGTQVSDQARRRVLNGEQVPTAEKIRSSSRIRILIKRRKVRTPVEFGHFRACSWTRHFRPFAICLIRIVGSLNECNATFIAA
jgi:hypothetical protein